MAKKKTSDLSDPTPATHGDLNIWGNRITELLEEKPDRKDLTKMATEEDLQKVAKQITDHFDKHIDVVIENRASELLGVKHDEVREIQRKVKNHEQRITALE